MKNIFIYPTTQPSHIGMFSDLKGTRLEFYNHADGHIFPNWEPHFIYIVDDLPIKRNDYCIDTLNSVQFKATNVKSLSKDDKRIVLTNNPKLINEGIQQLDLEFIKLYVKNPVSWVHIETNYYMPQSNGKVVNFPFAFEINLTDPTQNTLAYHVASVPNKIIETIPRNNIISDWLEKHGDPEIAKQVEEEAEALMSENTDEDMIQFLQFVNKKYIRVKGFYYMKGDYEKSNKISDPRTFLEEFKKEKGKILQKKLYSEKEMLNFGKHCHKEAHSVNPSKTFEESLENFKKQ